MLDYAKNLKKQGIQIYVLSNNFKERTTYYREHFPQLFDYLDHAYFSWETGFMKPDVQAWRNILEKNNLYLEECLYFDDSKKNINVANGLGIKAVLYENLKETTKRINEF